LALLLALAICGPCLSQTYTIQTVAGGGLPENIQGLSAILGAVYGIAADGPGNVYIALADYHIVLRLDTNGNLTRVAGSGTAGFSGDGGPATSAQLSNPRGVAVDSAGDLYIADAGNNRIRKVSGGTIGTVVGGGTSLGDEGPGSSAQLKGPLDVAVDGSGSIYIADTGNHRIRMVTGGNIITIAGTGTAGYTGDGGESPDAQLSSPTGVALGPAGKLYIVDYGNKCIRSIDASHTIRTEVSGLSSPRGVAVNQAGTVYIAEAGRNVIKQLSNGVVSIVAGTGRMGYNGDYMPPTSANLNGPSDVAVDGEGRLFIADTGDGLIRQVAPRPTEQATGGVLQIISVAGYPLNPAATSGPSIGDKGPATSGQLLGPNDVALDAAGNLYIADMNNNRVREVSGGVISTVAGGGGNGPASVATDAAGNLYIAVINDCLIRKVSNGQITTVLGGGGNLGDGAAAGIRLDHPSGVATDSAGSMYVADGNNNVIRKVSGGLSTIIAGMIHGRGYSGDDGPATSATMNQPVGVAVDGTGNVYIADFNNNRIRRVTEGTITTVAGTGAAGYGGDNGPAVNAQLNGPSDVAVDGDGNIFIADYGNHAIRRLSGGVISTIAGTGAAGYGGDNGPAGGAQLNSPAGLALDGAGNVFVADYGNQLVRRLASSGPSCAYSVGPGSFTVSISGGTITASISTSVSCPWAISNLPSWIILSGKNIGAGPASVMLVVAGTGAGSRSAVISIAGLPVRVAQEGPACSYTITPPSVTVPTAGGSFNLHIDTADACPWTMTGLNPELTSPGPTTGTGPATLTFVKTPGGPGSEVFFIAGIKVLVTFAATTCTYTVSPSPLIVGTSGGSVTAKVGTAASCAWAVGSVPSWLSVAGIGAGLGPGSVTFIAAPSPNGPHGGSLYIANLTVTITQQAVNPNCVIRSPTISSVKSATDFGGFSTFASGSYLEVKGTNLAIGQRQWAAGDFQGPNAPQDLDGTSVSINGKLGFVSFISAQQINVQAPADSATGSAQITVTNCGGISAPAGLTKAAVAPGILAPAAFNIGGKQYLVALFSADLAQGNVIYVGNAGLIAGANFRPAKPGDVIILYGLGFGAVTPSTPPGVIASGVTNLANLSASFGQTVATLGYAGLYPGFVGLYEFYVTVPNVPDGDYPINISVGGTQVEQTLFLTVHR
jgi:uncharacterized protein (TIGR03437 family)